MRAKVGGDDHVICGLSGGVDSSVAAILCHRALGDRLTCIFVDNGLLRQGEAEQVVATFRESFHLNLVAVDAREQFLSQLRGVTDPEQKRKIIGRVFIEVFEEEAKKVARRHAGSCRARSIPDVIESVSFKGPSAVIKSHHNVGGLPEKMKLQAHRAAARAVQGRGARRRRASWGCRRTCSGASRSPGRAWPCAAWARCTEKRLEVLREADAIVIDEIRAAGLYDDIWQAFAVLLPVQDRGGHGRRADVRGGLRRARGQVGRRHDRRLGEDPARGAGAHLERASATRCAASTAWSSTSRASRRGRSSGSESARRPRPRSWPAPACLPGAEPREANGRPRCRCGCRVLPVDAVVVIDDQALGTLELVMAHGVALPVGVHHVTVKADGYFPWDRRSRRRRGRAR